MGTLPGDHAAFLRELEFEVREELALAEAIESATDAVEAPVGEWLSDPADDQRYEVSLHVLLGAVEAMEDGSPLSRLIPAPAVMAGRRPRPHRPRPRDDSAREPA